LQQPQHDPRRARAFPGTKVPAVRRENKFVSNGNGNVNGRPQFRAVDIMFAGVSSSDF
jgi:hypothetical protein